MRKKNINSKYKDRLFRLAFREKRDLLELYNAVNGSSYQDSEALEITTLEDVVYMGMKNDISFLIDDIYRESGTESAQQQSAKTAVPPISGVL